MYEAMPTVKAGSTMCQPMTQANCRRDRISGSSVIPGSLAGAASGQELRPCGNVVRLARAEVRMPFDGIASPYYKHLEKLDEAIYLLRSPARWCKGSERNVGGQYCIRGALLAVGAWDTLRPVVTA